jgi:penicillin-binding protein A
VNRQIVHLFGVVALLFALLVGYGTRWAVVEQEELESEAANRRPLLEEQRIPRGDILARDGTVLARSRARGRGENRFYTRAYPQGALFGHIVGYSFIERGRAGLEQSLNDVLASEENEFATVIEELTGGTREGDDVRTTLDPDAQRVALQALGGRRGAVVAIEPRTGSIRVMASVPTYDPNRIPDAFSQLVRDSASPLLNRATQATYPPGSTFKVVTAGAALDGRSLEPDTIVDGSSPKEISGVPLENFGGQDFGPIPFTDALTNSVNTVFADLGVKLGRGRLVDYMQDFGFYSDPELDFPDSQMAASGVYEARGGLVREGFDAGRVAIGQGGEEGQIRATPLQMAQVAAAVANEGVLMRPRIVDRIVRPDGRIRERVRPEEQERAISEEAAADLTAMMSRVVEEGTGTAAALAGIPVAGKTGTAEVEGGRSNQAWFIAFAPVESPRIAIAVTVERTQGTGGTVAAPIAKQVLEELLSG